MNAQNKVQAVASAMLSDLQKNPREGGAHGCVFAFMPASLDNINVRGHIDLLSLARAAIEAAGERSAT